MKKYELILDDKKEFNGITLYRIRALIAIGSFVMPGDLGGYIEKEDNLSHYGQAWVYGQARVSGEACVYGEARVSGEACVYGQAWVSGEARVYGQACVYGQARVSGEACVYGQARVSGEACVYGQARVSGEACVYGQAWVSGQACVEKTFHYMNIAQMKFNLTFTLHNVAGGCRLFTHKEFKKLTLDKCESEWREGELENFKAFQELFWKQVEINDPTLKAIMDLENGTN